ncbi:MAG: type VI secretion system tube protein Hcp [Cellvibrionaceae bacterium]|nr:type VI secretion system tube protein Hcp [Cellvibrionaceae bacterium]
MSIFVNYDGIKGECSDPAHKEWMDVLTCTYDISRAITSATSTQGDRESSNTEIKDLVLTKYTDSATPKTFLESCCGTGKDVTIHFTKTGTGGGADVFLELKLKNALISNYSFSGKSQGASRPHETLTLSFVEMEVKYTPYDEDGNATAPISVGFDTATNTKK